MYDKFISTKAGVGGGDYLREAIYLYTAIMRGNTVCVVFFSVLQR